MLELPGYTIYEKVNEYEKTIVYRGYISNDKIPVVIKVLKTATPADISNFIYEYELTRSLNIEGIIKPMRLENTNGNFAMVVADSEDITLKKFFENNTPVELPHFFGIAVQLSQILGELHQHGIIHSSLNPESILINPDTGKVKIANFSLAFNSYLKSENNPMISAEVGNLQYMSPEQLGIAGNGIDYRSDYYSLGVVFYEMLTGRFPFNAETHEEWIRVHASQKPEAPDKINSNIPSALSAIILKLLSKTADERYQTANGLVRDLEECRRQWNTTGSIEPFVLGQADTYYGFRLPCRLIGRESETETLKAAFKCACDGKGELILLGGYAGTGKTMLINEVLQPLAMEKGYFGYGKFDQLRKNLPYAPYVNALGNVIRQLMTEHRDKLELWRCKILHALGQSGAVITELIPEIEMIIGEQPTVETLQPKEAQNRFQMLFGNFIKVFAEMNTTLVIFLDDLQWADMASLHLLKYLSQYTGLDHLLIIGAYRDNEINENHPLAIIIEELRQEEIPFREICLNSLDRKEVTEYLAEALHSSGEELGLLADTMYRKTCGNPFFLGQMIKSVYEDKLITFNIQKGCWEWETESIQNLSIPDDVIDFILLKLQKLPQETLDVLKLASCIGSTFDMKILSVVCGKTAVETYSLLLPAIMEGLVLPVSHSGKVLQASHNYSVVDINEFLHDRVRQAVYFLLSEEEKKNVHVKIGRLLLQNFYSDGPEDIILSIVDHFNRGLELISDPNERLKVAEYNLQAGQKAKSSVAYDLAMNCFKAGITLLPENAWDSCYRLCYDLHLECAQCEYMVGNIDEAEKLFNLIISQAKTKFEIADLQGMKMILYAGTGKYDKAVQIGMEALKKLGMKVPVNPGKFDNFKELLFYKRHMRGKKAEDLLRLPEMKNQVQRKVAELLTKLILVTSTAYPDLYSFAIIKAGNHALKYGNTEMAPIGYIGYSIVEGSVLGNYTKGDKLGKVAITLAEKYDKNISKCIVHFTIGAIIHHWTHHAKEGLEYLQKAIDCALEAGDVLMAGFSYVLVLENKYILGLPLGEILDEAQKYSNYAGKVKHENLGINTLAYNRIANLLTNKNGMLFSTEAQNINEEELLKPVTADKAALSAHYYTQIQLCYLAGNYRGALSLAERVKNLAGAIMGFLISAECNFYLSLAITAVIEEMSLKERRRLKEDLKKNQRQMKKWANSCGANFLHKYLLIEAEIARISGKKQEAETLYDQAIQSAHENGYTQNEAIACELAARFYIAEGRLKVAKTYMNDAFNLYSKWGAIAKAQDLKRRYPDLLDEVTAKDKRKDYDSVEAMGNILRHSNVNASKTSNNSPDVHTIQKAIESISEQSEADKLLETFLDIAMESVFANKGYLILERDDELFVEAAKDSESGFVMVLESIPLEQSDKLSRLIVRYVARTLETVVMNGNNHAGIFIKDPYIAQSSVKSIACIPLQLRGILVGVLYLENSLMAGVFTEERLGLLKILADRMAYTKALQEFLEGNSLRTKKENPLPPFDLFTEKEIEVLKLVSAGLSNKEVAERLDVSVNTVKTHIKNIYEKLQVNRRVQAVEKAKSLNIL
ncbi:MAG: AAA family ATPase [Peptococcaceae bacterium]|nr:AAA family ATPase [Peptococcaceae bacterium]